MLYPYKYVDHNISQLQDWVDYLFIHVWCNARKPYNIDVLNGCPKLKAIVLKEQKKEDPTNNDIDYISGPIRNIHNEFLRLRMENKRRSNQIKALKKWYKRARNIERVCSNQKFYTPLRIKDIDKISPVLGTLIKSFFGNLYEHILGLGAVKAYTGTLDNHYKLFVKTNNSGICPFCGISTIRSYAMKGHEAYDHYIPEGHFPFTAVNFKNLVPTCHDCNSIHKLQEKLIFNKKGKRRRVFYPYSNYPNDISVKMEVKITNYKAFEHGDITINFSSEYYNDEVDAWKEVYKVDKRYKDLLCNEGEGKYWLVQYLEEMNLAERQQEKSKFQQRLTQSRFKGKNFLKIPFIEACEIAGLISF